MSVIDSGRGHRRKKEKEVLMDHDGADSLKHVFVPHPLNVTLNLRAFKNGELNWILRNGKCSFHLIVFLHCFKVELFWIAAFAVVAHFAFL